MIPKLLLIEDHDDFRRILKEYLLKQDLGLHIYEAASGEDGVVLALDLKPDVILMDLRLPGMNGIEAANQVKVKLPDCEIIILTMFDTDSFRNIFRSEAISSYIGKSELFQKLVPVLKRLWAKKELAGQPNPVVVT